MTRHLTLLFLLLLTPGIQAATDIRINAVEVLSWGMFEFGSASRHADFSRTTAGIDKVKGVEFVEYTNDIPMEPHVNFGFQYILNTAPKGRFIDVTHIIKFPGEGLRTPGGRVYKQSTEQLDIRIGRPTLHGYGFDFDWEMIPGDWVFEVWHRDARLVRKTFHIVPPDSAE